MTRPITLPSLSIVLSIVAAGAALAQAQTGTGGGPTSTVTAPNTSSVGRVMPPSRGAGTADDRRERTPREAENDKVLRGICIGCAPR